MHPLWNILQFGWPYLRRYWPRLFAGVILGVLFGFSNGLFVWLTKTLIERLSGTPFIASGTPTGWMGGLAALQSNLQHCLDPWLPMMGRTLDWRAIVGGVILVAFPMLLRGTLSYLAGYCMGWVSERVVNDLRTDVFSKLTGLSLDFFHRSTSGDLITRINGDTGAVHQALRQGFADLIKEPVSLVTLLTAVILLDWQLAMIACVFLVACGLPMRYLGRKARRASQGAVQATVTQSGQLVEALAGIRVVKAYGLEKEQIARYRALSRQLVHHGMKGVQARELSHPIIDIVAMFGFGVLVVWIVGTQRYLSNMTGFLTGVMLMQAPLKRIANLNLIFQQASISTNRLQQLFREQPTVVEPSQPRPLDAFRSAICFDNVSFSYGHQLVLENLSLSIPRGIKLGIAGESGSGKSTLINLLLRFYDPTQGRVLLDEVDVRALATADLRRWMALVSQEIVLFDKTVAENIAMGRDGATREEIEEAARQAYATDFIRQLPHGFDTRIGERGVTLSGGQRQRIAIARAIVRNAPILVLDEATASLDSQSEAEVQGAIDRLAQNRTVIMVAHRLATLRAADQLIVLSGGRIVEQGSFDELLRSHGLFATMAARQGIVRA